jgi:putative membrane protein
MNSSENLKKIILMGFLSASVSIIVLGQAAPKLADDEIASVAVVANQGDIDFAKIAKQKSKDQEVLKFAETMAKDHQSVIDQAVALVTKLKVTPKDNDMSRKLTSDATATKKKLQAASASSFNKTYIDNEVGYHKAVIAAVEGVLIPQASNPELKQLLENVVPTLKAHLEHAEMVQKTFASK